MEQKNIEKTFQGMRPKAEPFEKINLMFKNTYSKTTLKYIKLTCDIWFL